MARKQLFICDLLQRREIGSLHRNEIHQLTEASTGLADKLLVHNNVIKTIPCIDDRSRSSYMAVTNTKGIAAMTHSNRCISLIDTGTMKRIAEIDGLTRTVWTLCFHPHNPNLLATGDLGGTVCVFYGTTKIQSRLNDSYPVTSISFHSKEPLIFYSIDNRIVIWNYEENFKIIDLFAMEESRIKYVKYNPTNDMLITGIRRENQMSSFDTKDEPDENHETRLISCSSFFDRLLRSLSSIIDNIDPNSFVNLGKYWSHIHVHTSSYYNVLKSCDKVQLQPVKFIGDFNVSLALMQVRVHQIARMVFRCDNFSNDDILNVDSELVSTSDEFNYYSIRNTLEAINYILKMYKNEVKQFKCVDHLEFSTLADIIVTIHRILNLNDLSNLIRQNIQRSDLYQYRLQAWNMANMQETYLPDFSQNWRNLITYCYIHNDSTVELSRCGTMIASFEVASSKKIITVHSLEKSTLGQYICSYGLDSDEILMSLSFSPSSEYLLVGVRSSKIFGCFLKIAKNRKTNKISPPIWIHNSVDSIENNDDQIAMLKRSLSNPDVISYLKWSARSGDGVIIGYKTYQLRCLVRR
ncbi:uncharacterized protein LOC129574540 [Sitodiplosis mosellana]|uniref:uncharacterized protein LOC129574540 n=1 Tax=Sitodiplosis mosellana TaxID=263140 RepID=UPI0024445593|nr:uncharacterized protein LOC129574540 [Sitodiplosis mosellana]